jgi:hypothetical protein
MRDMLPGVKLIRNPDDKSRSGARQQREALSIARFCRQRAFRAKRMECAKFPCTLHVSPIPKGLRPPAQGCLPSEVLLTKEGEATLGTHPQNAINPNGVAPLFATP